MTPRKIRAQVVLERIAWLGDIDHILDEILAWLRAHPELLDKSL